jgi:hypothetical protein
MTASERIVGRMLSRRPRLTKGCSARQEEEDYIMK